MIDLKNITPSVRLLEEMTELVYDRQWLQTADPRTELYYVWRDAAENDRDKKAIAQAGLRYDITEFAPLTLGKECNKTYGHTHSLVPGTGLTYTEIYEILEGEVCFLFQKFNRGKIEDIAAVPCRTGDKYVVFPGYAHFSISPTGKKAVMANWLAIAAKQGYREVKEMKGAGYYALQSEKGVNWVKNENYAVVPELRFEQPNNLSQFGIDEKQPMYRLVNNLKKLDFLKNPQKYEWK